MGRASAKTLPNAPKHWDDKHGRRVEQVVLKIIENWNVSAGRKNVVISKLDMMILLAISWLGSVLEKKHGKCIVEIINSGSNWTDAKKIKLPEIEDFLMGMFVL